MPKKKLFNILISSFCFILVGFSSKTYQEKNQKEQSLVEDITFRWNAYVSKHHTDSLSFLYADQVNHYGVMLTNKEVVFAKKSFFKREPHFTQKIIGPLQIKKSNQNEYQVTFNKSSVLKKKTTNVTSYLIIKKTGTEWKITKESDYNTDTVIKKSEAKNKTKLKTCLDVVLEIVQTSPQYLKSTKGLYEAVVKNGGTSIGLTVNGSPNPERDHALSYSKTYDISLHETYPDRMPTLEHYCFDPIKKKFYLYDVAEDRLKPIAFDYKLISHFEKLCR